jgi:DNA-binding transcriptional MerR regulator
MTSSVCYRPRVEDGSGYRYYSASQLDRARLIAALRQLQIPLGEIKSIVSLETNAAAERITEHWNATEIQHAARRDLARYLIDDMQGKRHAMYEVATRDIPARSVLSVKRSVEGIDAAWAFGKEFISILRNHDLPRMDGRAGAFYCIWWGEVSDDSDGPLEWCRPVPNSSAQRCSLVCHPSTLCCATSSAGIGAGEFTFDLPSGFSCCGPAVRLRHADGFPVLGLLRGLRHPRAHQQASHLAWLPPAARHARSASHVHLVPFDRVGNRLYRYSASDGRSQPPIGHHARANHPGVERAAVNQSGVVAVDGPCPPGFGPLVVSSGFYHRIALALPFGLASTRAGVWQYRPAVTLSGRLTISA